MAFSNYLGTTVLMTALFYGWGIGLVGTGRHAPRKAGFVLLGWALMLGWSAPWLARFRQGPLEWLWRSLVECRVLHLQKVDCYCDPFAVPLDSQREDACNVRLHLQRHPRYRASRRRYGDCQPQHECRRASTIALGRPPQCRQCIDDAEDIIFEERQAITYQACA